MNMKGIVNERRCVRFQVPSDTAYAVLRRHWPRSSIMGNIVDISLGGLSFRYIVSEKCSYRSSHIDILLTDGSFRLNKVRVNTISDLKVDSETSLNFATRRCGMQFVDLTDKRESDLRYFIETYTTANPEA
jgi:c-di-GMP-binding flagellar brake protein YcgR